MADAPTFTIFVPTFNRGYCIEDALQSCERSTFRDLEIVLVDDGSTDDTASRVEAMRSRMSLPLRYEYQENQGKHVAFNRAVQLAKGTLFVTLDSDDRLLPDGLQQIDELWRCIPQSTRAFFAGVEFRCLEDGVPSSAYPEPYVDCHYMEKAALGPSHGEKRYAYRLDVLKEYPYPVFEGERYCRPGLIDMRISKRYMIRLSNIVAIDAGHYADGIGANRRRIIASAPKAYRQYFLEAITEHAQYLEKSALRSYYRRYSRSSFNARVGARTQLSEVPDKWRLLALLPETYLSSALDRLRWHRSR